MQKTMLKQSSSRNNRSKGNKSKYVLQICLLVALCFWLTYQIKHSHEKKKEFETKDGKVVEKVQTDGEIQRFGRKDLPRAAKIANNVEEHGEDEDDKEEDEEENKHEEDEPERDEEEDRGRGGGDDEIDENEPEKIERGEEIIDEDKYREENHTENEENEDVGKENHGESDVGSNEDDHEAREEQYKGDDASSEVAHDVQTIIPETENAITGRANETRVEVNIEHENETKTDDKTDDLIKNGTFSDVIVTEQKNEINLTKLGDISLENSTLPEKSSNSIAENSTLLVSNGTQMGDYSGNDSLGEKSENGDDEGIESIQHDPIDESDTSLTQEEKETRMDLDTLPEIRTEIQNTEDTMVE